MKKIMHEYRAQDRDNQGEDGGKDDSVSHTPSGPLLVSGSVFLAGENRKTGGNPYGKAYNQEHNSSGGTNTGQGLSPNELPHDDGIHHVIKLLKYIAQVYRKHKLENYFQRFPLGHVGIFFVILIIIHYLSIL